jgi:hypothetical protein
MRCSLVRKRAKRAFSISQKTRNLAWLARVLHSQKALVQDDNQTAPQEYLSGLYRNLQAESGDSGVVRRDARSGATGMRTCAPKLLTTLTTKGTK